MKDNSISFIVIGKNEESKIFKCLNSISVAIEMNKILDYEILYIDSESTDHTLAIVKKFENVIIYSVTGQKNAAISRNIGAKQSIKKILFFIDGDMEVIPETLELIYTTANGLIYDFVSGDFENCFYDESGNYIDSAKHHNLKHDVFQITTGGLFLITKFLWNEVSGMRNKFRIGEDMDLGLRLSAKGYKLLRKKEILANHHTISYNRNDRLWLDVIQGNFLYYKSLLYREHMFNKFIYKFLAREVTMFFLAIILFISIYLKNPFYLCIYLIMVLVKLIYKRRKVKGNYWFLYVRYIIFDVGTLLGFFLFWPNSNNKIAYERIK